MHFNFQYAKTVGMNPPFKKESEIRGSLNACLLHVKLQEVMLSIPRNEIGKARIYPSYIIDSNLNKCWLYAGCSSIYQFIASQDNWNACIFQCDSHNPLNQNKKLFSNSNQKLNCLEDKQRNPNNFVLKQINFFYRLYFCIDFIQLSTLRVQ